MPNLSIVIPTRNRPELLRRTLRSLAAGRSEAAPTGAQLETIVVDNGSDGKLADQTRAACRELADCIYLRLPTPRGATAARNHGAAIASAGAIWFLDQGDSAPVETILAISSAVISRSTTNQLLAVPMQVTRHGEPLRQIIPTTDQLSPTALRRNPAPVHTSCLIVPRWLLDRIGGWNEHLESDHDAHFLLRASRHAPAMLLAVPGILVEDRNEHPLLEMLPVWSHRRVEFLSRRWQQLDAGRHLQSLRVSAANSLERLQAIDRRAVASNLRQRIGSGIRTSGRHAVRAGSAVHTWWRARPWSSLHRFWQERLAMRSEQYDDVPIVGKHPSPTDSLNQEAAGQHDSSSDDRSQAA